MNPPSTHDRIAIDPLVETVVGAAVRRSPPPPEAAAALLLDFLANAGGDAVTRLVHASEADAVGWAAASAHRDDLDDLHWPSLTHPGSVVWAAALGTAMSACTGVQLRRAAAIGYDVTAGLARIIGAAGITRWHRTAVAGHAGAAAAVAALRRADDEQCTRAVALALTMAGGVGQTMIERSSAGAFHRACAARNGAAAVDFSLNGITAPAGVLSGPAGLLAACGGSAVEARAVVQDPPAIDETTVRVYPTTGFAQAAVAATLRARTAWDGPVDRIVVRVHSIVAAQFAEPPASRHWDLIAAVRTAWATADGWSVDRSDLDTGKPGVELIADDAVDVGAAVVSVRAGDVVLTELAPAAFSHPRVDPGLALEKWSRMGVVCPDERLGEMRDWLDSDERADWRLLSAAAAGDSDRRPRR